MFGAFQRIFRRHPIGRRALDSETGKGRMVCADAEILALQPDRFIGPIKSALSRTTAPRPAWNELAIDCSRFCSADNEHREFVRSPIALWLGAFAGTRCDRWKSSRNARDGIAEIHWQRFSRGAYPSNLVSRIFFGSGELSGSFEYRTGNQSRCRLRKLCRLRVARQGQRIPWSDPKRLREHLDFVARSTTPGIAKITAEDLQRGTIVHSEHTSLQ